VKVGVANAAIAFLAVIVAGLIPLVISPPRAVTSGGGQALYAQYCASCHGTKLEGQPNWRERNADGFLPAPPHDANGHTWHHSDQQLLRIVRDGLASIAPGYKTTMPAFGPMLSDPEIQSILDHIKSTWPERERASQAARTKADASAPPSKP